MPSLTRIPHDHVEHCSYHQHNTTHMEVGQHSPHPKTQQRHTQGHFIQDHITPLSHCKDTGEEPSSLHNCKHTKLTHASREQKTTLYSDGTTHSKQHRSEGVQPNGSPCENNHCSIRYEQSFRHHKHTYTYLKAATDQDTSHNH